MALVTNRCAKHGNVYPEKDCPHCQAEAIQQARVESHEFFAEHGDHIVRIEVEVGVAKVSVEELYQYFKTRLLSEINPAQR